MKKIIKKIMIVLIILVFVYITVNNNLKTYSIYYAKNMPNTRKEIEMMILVDNIDSVYRPAEIGFEYEFTGINCIMKKMYINGKYVKPNFHNDYDESIGSIYIWEIESYHIGLIII